MFFAILALVEVGDEVLMPNPAFPIYESMVDFVGGRSVFVPLRQENDFRFDLDEFRANLSEKTRLVILNSPANPTGGVFTPEDVSGLADVLRDRPDVSVLSDEIYGRLIYDGAFASIASEPGLGPDERTIILDGFSKTYAMTGWRLGYGVMPHALAEEVTKLQVNSNSCASAVAQHAGLEAIAGPQESVDRMLSEFRARRDLIVSGLNDLPGVECATPKGPSTPSPRHRHGPRRRRSGRPAARRGRGRLPLRDGVRAPRRRTPEVLLRQLAREHLPRHRTHGRAAFAGRGVDGRPERIQSWRSRLQSSSWRTPSRTRTGRGRPTPSPPPTSSRRPATRSLSSSPGRGRNGWASSPTLTTGSTGPIG